ncbi:MAG: CDP-alcohol phosphatidyltransferase family protein [Thermodesulfovibrionia bacterium]
MVAGSLPNILTLTRILLLPFLAFALIYQRYDYALILFLGAGVTDALDGFIARIRKQTTYFGSILDPVADKFLLLTSFVLMSIYGLMPKWLTIIVISRDLIVVTGCIILYFVIHNLKIEPSFLGKAANACQFLLIGLILLSRNLRYELSIPMFFFVVVALLTAVSGVHYAYKGLKIANSVNTERV